MAHTYEVCFLFLRSGQVSEFMTRIIKFGTWVLANHACPLLPKDTAFSLAVGEIMVKMKFRANMFGYKLLNCNAQLFLITCYLSPDTIVRNFEEDNGGGVFCG
uniref:Uncharacterized protein n=1 Tax=Cucumis sativus TaxID=3659 RepID=A0A0A0K5W5_CUCSA